MATQAVTVSEAIAAGMQASERNAKAGVISRLVLTIEILSRQRTTLTTDDVWEAYWEAYSVLKKNGEHLPVFLGDRSVIGPAMMKAVKNGIISVIEGKSKKSTRPSSHGRLLRVFKSNIATDSD